MSERSNHLLVLLLPLIEFFHRRVELVEIFLNELVNKRVHLLLEFLGDFFHHFHKGFRIALFEQLGKFIEFAFQKFIGLRHIIFNLDNLSVNNLFKFANLFIDFVFRSAHARNNIKDFAEMMRVFANLLRILSHRIDSHGLLRSSFFNIGKGIFLATL